ncbi:MAG TPA: flagellar protein FlaG [Desulfuromonadales bacterium]|nr:flagellar protein FlaG [Desulfuromonadales bacterium]
MNIENISSLSKPVSKVAAPEETANRERRDAQTSASDPEKLKRTVAPEELLDKIKALTEDGLYSVRFEARDETGELQVRVVDQESGEVIREIPPEKLLGIAEKLDEFRGMLVDKKV